MVAPGQTPDTKWIDGSIVVDAITGLGNMFALLQALRQGLQDAAQQPGTLLALVILNIVHDPQYMDQSVNDEISQSKLQTIVSRLQEALEDMTELPLQSTLYRFSNNEFALLVKHNDCRQLRRLICHLQTAWPILSGPKTNRRLPDSQRGLFSILRQQHGADVGLCQSLHA